MAWTTRGMSSGSQFHIILRTGDAVRYDTRGKGSIGGALNGTTTFFVRKVDDYTIKLFTTGGDAETALTGFTPSAVAADAITLSGVSGFSNGDVVVYYAPASSGFAVRLSM